MHKRTILLILVASLASACGDDATPVEDASVDASVDAGETADAGFGPSCGDAQCLGTEFCLVEPTSPCEPVDAGSCGAGQEACTTGAGGQGCAAPPSRSCTALPSACSNAPSCACLIASNPCSQSLNPDCLDLVLNCRQ